MDTEDSNIDQLIDDLRHEDWNVRYAAADQLKAIRDTRVVPFLVALLDDENLTVRFIVAMTLGVIGDKQAVDPLVEALRHNDDYDVLWSIAWALSEMGVIATDPLIEIVIEGNALARDIAADILGNIGDARAISPLAEAFIEHGLKDYPETARFGAADALEKFGADAAPIFLEALKHSQPEICVRAATALGVVGRGQAVKEALSGLLDDTRIAFPGVNRGIQVCDAAAESLIKLNSETDR